MDPVLLTCAVPAKIYWLASRHLYHIPWLRWFLQHVDTFPLLSNTSETVVRLLSEDKCVGMFPEGKCARKGELGKFRRGTSLVAMKTGRPVVPCAVIGASEALPVTARFPKLWTPVRVRIGRPVYLLKESTDLIDDIYLQEGTMRIRNEIRRLRDGK